MIINYRNINTFNLTMLRPFSCNTNVLFSKFMMKRIGQSIPNWDFHFRCQGQIGKLVLRKLLI